MLVGSCLNKTERPVTVLKWDSTVGAFWGIFQNLENSHQLPENSCFCNQSILHRYLHIFPVHFYLNHSESYGYSQVNIIIGIHHITLLVLLCFTCRLEIMQIGISRLIRLPTHSLIIDSQLATYILVELQLLTRKLSELQFAI